MTARAVALLGDCSFFFLEALSMLEAIVIICGLLIVGILFYPRRSPYVRRVTRSYNGQHYGKGRELY
ncbi:hypothetical protein [Candidatus Leptofilum sp.]|uniref:hypothetical protein n=1 Tax=Candidatus Leptofilum sp. TaxID=3241576 RepID=UPI003B5CECBA